MLHLEIISLCLIRTVFHCCYTLYVCSALRLLEKVGVRARGIHRQRHTPALCDGNGHQLRATTININIVMYIHHVHVHMLYYCRVCNACTLYSISMGIRLDQLSNSPIHADAIFNIAFNISIIM